MLDLPRVAANPNLHELGRLLELIQTPRGKTDEVAITRDRSKPATLIRLVVELPGQPTNAARVEPARMAGQKQDLATAPVHQIPRKLRANGARLHAQTISLIARMAGPIRPSS